jgi:ATP-dependent DNA helicase RecQ
MERLAFKDERFFKMSFVRKNVIYVVRPTVDKQKELVHILRHVPGCAIVYVRSREKSRLLSTFLTESGISSTYYHAGLEPQDKDERQEKWTRDEVRVMVATNAFGMGIDKPDVRLVVHFDCPDAIEAYFQEAGRAGRDGQKSYAVLLWDDQMDQRMMLKRVEMNFPPKDKIADVYEHLAYFYQVGVGSGAGHTFLFNIDKFCAAYHLSPFMVPAALQLLQYAGYIDYNSEPDSVSRVRIMVSRDELYRLRLPAQEDLVLTVLLRLCDGIFTRYSFFDLNEVAERTQLSEQQTYLVLKTLSAKHIIHFIPNRHIPQITYLQDRVSIEEVVIPPHVYEDRKQKYEQRLKAMMDYVLNDQECRSRQLLAYFGEETEDDCGQCDVCVQHRKDYRQRVAALPRQILDLLSDGDPHDLSVLRSLHFDKDTVTAAVQSLADDEKVDIGINTIRLHNS